VEPDDRRRSIFERLAAVEDQHVERWRTLFREHGSDTPAFVPSVRGRVLAWVAGRFGTSAVLPLVLAGAHDTAVAIASESASHAQELSDVLGRSGEPWHTTAGSTYLRSVVYGFNDGLTANFGLVAGVVGAEVAARQIALERDEIRMMPDLEETELALVYEARGLTPARARETAAALMADPARALDASVSDELGIRAPVVSPLSDGMVTGAATAVGALIPLVPFLVMPSANAIWVSLTVSMLAHFGVGAARSVFTGRGLLRSGWDMFLVGFGVAAAGYLIGSLLLS
jgi:VIT1/CCC1 family predicted Fe2+/Mn2+ transporter